jgi:hypothetical protein
MEKYKWTVNKGFPFFKRVEVSAVRAAALEEAINRAILQARALIQALGESSLLSNPGTGLDLGFLTIGLPKYGTDQQRLCQHISAVDRLLAAMAEEAERKGLTDLQPKKLTTMAGEMGAISIGVIFR